MEGEVEVSPGGHRLDDMARATNPGLRTRIETGRCPPPLPPHSSCLLCLFVS